MDIVIGIIKLHIASVIILDLNAINAKLYFEKTSIPYLDDFFLGLVAPMSHRKH